MKETRLIMGLPITVEVVDSNVNTSSLDEVFAYFVSVDERFSPFKPNSEVSQLNKRLKEPAQNFLIGSHEPQESSASASATSEKLSHEMQEIIWLAEKTKQETNGYFDIQKPDGSIDPSGIVKGWAIKNAADMIAEKGYKNYYVEAGGDIQCAGTNAEDKEWSVGIRNPFNVREIVKVIYPRGKGIATSGSYERGSHIYNPHSPTDTLSEVVSITVVGPDVLEADRFATAAFAMGVRGVTFIETLPGFEAYSIDRTGVATMTRNFSTLTV
jgi:thiamine biosynthesis lipoprotein